MKDKESIVKLVFGCINEVVSTTENIHKSIIGNNSDASNSGFQEGGRRKHVYDVIKAVNTSIEQLVSGSPNDTK
jgi:hypothetical protein